MRLTLCELTPRVSLSPSCGCTSQAFLLVSLPAPHNLRLHTDALPSVKFSWHGAHGGRGHGIHSTVKI